MKDKKKWKYFSKKKKKRNFSISFSPHKTIFKSAAQLRNCTWFTAKTETSLSLALAQAQYTHIYTSHAIQAAQSFKQVEAVPAFRKSGFFHLFQVTSKADSNRRWISILLPLMLLRAPMACSDTKITPRFVIKSY